MHPHRQETRYLTAQDNSAGYSPVSPGFPAGEVRPRMGRRASHDLFEAIESTRFTEEEAKGIFRQIGELR